MSGHARLALVVMAALWVIGCSGSAPRSDRVDRSDKKLADHLSEHTKLDRKQAEALVATHDSRIHPRWSVGGWEARGDGQWSREFGGRIAYAGVNSYLIGRTDRDATRQLVAQTKKELSKFSSDPPKFRDEAVGNYLGRSNVARLDYWSLTPQNKAPVEHVQYIVIIGARVYNVIGAAEASIWPEIRPQVERFLRSLDLEHPEPQPLTIPPGFTGGPEDVQPLRAGASGGEVQDALSTWAYEPEGEKPWFPVEASCDEPSSPVTSTWSCTVDFFAPRSYKGDVPVTIRMRPDGSWSAEVGEPRG